MAWTNASKNSSSFTQASLNTPTWVNPDRSDLSSDGGLGFDEAGFDTGLFDDSATNATYSIWTNQASEQQG